MTNLLAQADALKEISTSVIKQCQPSGFDSSSVSKLIDALFLNATAMFENLQPGIDAASIQKMVRKSVVDGLLEQLYFFDTSENQIACLRELATINLQLNAAFEFVKKENDATPIYDRSEEDENILRLVNAIVQK